MPAWTPLLATVTARARELWPFIQAAAAEGIGPTVFRRTLEEAGEKVGRWQDVLALFREANNGELLKSDIARWPADVMLPMSRVRESVTKIVAPFSYTLRVTVMDEFGDEQHVLRQAHSTQLKPLAEVAESFLDSIQGREQYESMMVVDAEVVDVQRAGEFGTL